MAPIARLQPVGLQSGRNVQKPMTVMPPPTADENARKGTRRGALLMNFAQRLIVEQGFPGMLTAKNGSAMLRMSLE